jgi:hypothetical protein
VSKVKDLRVIQFDVLADAGGDDACSLPLGFGGHNTPHDFRVCIVKVADRFIDEKEIERLT